MDILSSLAPVAGQLIGGAVGGPVGATIGGNIGGMVKGFMGQSEAQGLKAKAESVKPPLEDPRQLAMLARLQQMQKSLETGAEFQSAREAATQNVAGTQAGIVRATGGDVGGTIQGLLQAQRLGGQQINQAYAQAGERQAQLTPLAMSLQNLISARKMELSLKEELQARAEWARLQQQANQNIGAASARLTGNIGDIFKAGSPKPDTGTKVTSGFDFMKFMPTEVLDKIKSGEIGGME